ncbi:MAG TPA: TonB-dependent receptor [Hyphomonadaceae bacterium]|jgi:TonB-dependent receptor|nr:TonB-dependent receptor [Hyphomonadaceae bacterium]
MRTFPLALAGLIAVAAAPTDATAQALRADAIVDPIPAGRLADVLLRLAVEANINIAFDATLIGERRTRGFEAPVSLRKALDELLTGSGLMYRLSPAGDVSVLAAPRPVEPLSLPPNPTGEAAPETVVVTGYRDGLDRAEARARRYDALVEIVSADAVGKLPDGNIADALDRMPSVYRISDEGEGRYLSLRGISEVLDTVTLNGVTIAASDTDGRSGRAAPLDVLSASAISDVEIHSVMTPDRDASAIGGLINVRTPTAHDFQGRIASLTTEIGGVDFGEGREIYAVRGAYSDTFGPDKEFGLYVGGEKWVREYLSPFYDNAEIAASDSGTSGIFPDRILMGASSGRRERTSLTAALDWRGHDDNAVWLRIFAANYDDDELRPEFLLYRRGDLSAPSLDAFSWRGLRVRTETRDERQERPVRQYVLGGRWTLNDDWTVEAAINRTSAQELNPRLNYYETMGDIDPADAASSDIGRFHLADGLAIPDGALTAPNGVSVFDGGFQKVFRIRRITSAVSEDTETQQVDLQRRGIFGAHAFSLQFGLKRLMRAKSVNDADNRYNFTGADTLANPALAGSVAGYSWGESYAIVPGLDLPVANPAGLEALFAQRPDLFVFDAASSRANSVEDDYHINETIWAGYAMAVVEATPALRLTLGARIEHTSVRATANAFVAAMSASGFGPGVDPFAGLPFVQSDILPTSGTRSYTNVSPAVLAKWDAGEAWVLRASLTHTFARPDYVDLAPISTLSVSAAPDPTSGAPVLSATNEIGNPNLRPIDSRNWDASAQYNLPSGAGWVSLAGFYKSLDGLLFDVTEDRTNVMFAGVRFDNYAAVTSANVGKGHVSGLEASARYDFLEAPAPFDGFGLLVSAAFLDSSVSTPSLAGARPLVNQADRIYSTQLYYESGKFQARLAYEYQGRAPRSDDWSEATDNNSRAPYSRLDLKVMFDLDDNWRATFSGTNLTNTAYQTDRSTYPYLVGSGPGYEIYGREYRLSLTRRW